MKWIELESPPSVKHDCAFYKVTEVGVYRIKTLSMKHCKVCETIIINLYNEHYDCVIHNYTTDESILKNIHSNICNKKQIESFV